MYKFILFKIFNMAVRWEFFKQWHYLREADKAGWEGEERDGRQQAALFCGTHISPRLACLLSCLLWSLALILNWRHILDVWHNVIRRCVWSRKSHCLESWVVGAWHPVPSQVCTKNPNKKGKNLLFIVAVIFKSLCSENSFKIVWGI